MKRQLSGVLFDFDMTLVATRPVGLLALQRTIRKLTNAEPPSIETIDVNWKGPDAQETYRKEMARLHGVDPAHFERTFREEYVLGLPDAPFLKGAIDAVRALTKLGLPLAIVTGATKKEVETILAPKALMERFEAFVTRDDNLPHKPDPASFTLGARRLGIPPENCVAVEDSPSGVTSARAAGIYVVGVGVDQTGALAPWLSGADFVLPDLDQLVSTLTERFHFGRDQPASRDAETGQHNTP